ncbi:MAG TPA: type II secretion system F family protein, partial [Gammaproteobacteria bacterium]|nr:type II secretion system F family protein [Gammaproteobacteria bacterium]
MQHFRYTAVDRKGAQVSAAELADSESELVHRLRGKGLSPISIEQDAGGTRTAITSGVRSADLVDILRGLGTLFASHIPVDRALGLLAQTTDREPVVQLLTMLRESVSRGESLAGSMAQRSDVFPSLVISMIKAGEEAGILEHLVPELADFLDERER